MAKSKSSKKDPNCAVNESNPLSKAFVKLAKEVKTPKKKKTK